MNNNSFDDEKKRDLVNDTKEEADTKEETKTEIKEETKDEIRRASFIIYDDVNSDVNSDANDGDDDNNSEIADNRNISVSERRAILLSLSSYLTPRIGIGIPEVAIPSRAPVFSRAISFSFNTRNINLDDIDNDELNAENSVSSAFSSNIVRTFLQRVSEISDRNLQSRNVNGLGSGYATLSLENFEDAELEGRCAICFEDYLNELDEENLTGETVAENRRYCKINECKHLFHKKCLETWVRRNFLERKQNNCPLCRTSF
jgi:hypothetical protein